MRDPERIDRIAEKLRQAWHFVPDWRLGQLVSNLQGPGPRDVFFPEDELWEEMLDQFLGQLRG